MTIKGYSKLLQIQDNVSPLGAFQCNTQDIFCAGDIHLILSSKNRTVKTLKNKFYESVYTSTLDLLTQIQ